MGTIIERVVEERLSPGRLEGKNEETLNGFFDELGEERTKELRTFCRRGGHRGATRVVRLPRNACVRP
ncbi:MAG TPA: hypothetical protein VFZ09_11105 [Archangium sp.]|uniref:hypothetical protein n=1 Tax=Archangium sp. TaxID=1872627 RepID=UPI002E328331|nr:hypothetical protein [Archangium sp.]HEX5746786.1 hypothetical protein [Archangium sp.]